MTKNTATKRGQGTARKMTTSRRTIKQRAEAIINSPASDADTRLSIRRMLEQNAPDLAEMVRRAERGETICAEPSIAERARLIIADAEGYDIDTRQAIWLAVTNDYPELAEMVTRAEAGERITESSADPECDALARAFIALMDMPHQPDFLINSLTQLTRIIEEAIGVKLWLSMPGDDGEMFLSADTLARVFRHHELLRLEIERKKDLAELIAAVLNHPDVPVELHNDMGDAIGGLPGYGPAHKDPALIRAVLSHQPQETEQENA